MKVSIKLEYQDKVYTSDYKNVTESEFFEMGDFIENIVKGKINWLSFQKDNQTIYFGKNILEESIITLSIMSLKDIADAL